VTRNKLIQYHNQISRYDKTGFLRGRE